MSPLFAGSGDMFRFKICSRQRTQVPVQVPVELRLMMVRDTAFEPPPASLREALRAGAEWL